MSEFENVQERLTRLRPTLSPQLRKAATFLLENPGEIATQSMRTVASNSGVALPNFARLAKSMGFEKYNELRDVYRRQVQLDGADSYPQRADQLQTSGRASGDLAIWSSFRNSALQNIETAFNRIDAATVGSVVDELLSRKRIYIAGMQASYTFCAYLDYVGGMVLPSIKLLGRRGGVIADDLVDIGADDALICLAIQPCAKATVAVAELAFERGVFVVGITDSRASPLAAYSSKVLLTACESPLFFESYVGSTAIIEMLIGFMTVRSGPDAVERIARIEADRRQLGEYWAVEKEPPST